jgi:hypothetical protein
MDSEPMMDVKSNREARSFCAPGCLNMLWFKRDRIGQGYLVEYQSRLIAHPEHEATQAAIAFFDTVLALFICKTAGTWHERERPARQPDDVAIANVHRWNRQPITAVATPHCRHNPFAAHFRQYDRQKFCRNLLGIGNLIQLDRAVPEPVSKMLKRPNGVARFL